MRKYLTIFYQEVCSQYYNATDKKINSYIDSEIIETIAAQLAIYSIFIKNPSFQQEEEYRIAFIALKEKEIRDIIKFRVCNGVFIPYIEVKFNFQNSEERQLPLKEITIGPKNNIEIAQDGLRNMLDALNYDIEKVLIKKSLIPLRY